MKQYNVIIPSKLDLDKRLKIDPPSFKFNKDYSLWLISEIIKKTSYKLENDEEDIWIPMCSQITKNHPFPYDKHFRYLCHYILGHGNILYRRNYHKGSCYSYRLSPDFFDQKVTIYNLTDKKMLKFLYRDKYLKSNNFFKKKYNFLGKYFNEKLTINIEEANKKNQELFKKNLDYKKHLLNAMQIAEIANKEFSIKYTKHTDGRLHHQITRLSKEFRQFLRYDGKKLAECDVSASVPTIVSYILLNLKTSSEHLDNVVTCNKYYYRHYMFCKNVVEPINSEVELFNQKIVSGKFYETFIEGMHTIHHFDKSLKPDEYYTKNVRKIFGREFDGDMEDLRKVVKTNFLSMFNAKPSSFLYEEAEFNMHFPSILKWIKLFKKINHKYFAYLTLQLESYFMLEIVARKFNKNYSGKIPIFTLHDCLVTTIDNIDNLHDFMKEKLSEALKFTPALNIKVWE